MVDTIFGIVLQMYLIYFFLPTRNFDNGNTWTFIVPIFLALMVDTYHQVVWSWESLLLGQEEIDWQRSQCLKNHWNGEIVPVPFVIFILLCTLCVAFMFTLAFRKYVPIKVCYWLGCAIVFSLCTRI